MNNNTQPTIDLLKGAIGRSLHKVIHDLGCTSLPNTLLTQEQRKYLQAQIGELPADAQFQSKLMSGRVVQVGHAPEGQSLFTVRIHLNRLSCLLTLSFYRDQWELHAVDSVRSPRMEWSRLLVGAVAGAVVAAVVAFVIGGMHTTNAVSEAKKQGYVVLTEAEYQQEIHSSMNGSTKQPNSSDQKTGQTATSDSGNDTPIKFTMQDGMAVDDLTSFLKAQGLIQDQAAFDQELTQKGIDTLIRPGDYVFKKGMTKDEILNVLQGK